MCVQLRPVAVHVCVVHVGKVFFTLWWTGVIGHAGRGHAGYDRGRQRGMDGGGGDGSVVQRGQMLHVKGVGAVVQL